MSLPPKIKPASIVNAYLFYAQRLLQLEYSSPSMSQEADKQVLVAGVCLCLKQAWQAWLDELGRYLNKSLHSYTDCLLPEHREHPELEILRNLQAEPKSWFAQLLVCLEPVIQTSSAEEADTAPDALTDLPGSADSGKIQPRMINLVQLQDVGNKPKGARLPADTPEFLALIAAFKAYIRAVRARQEEW